MAMNDHPHLLFVDDDRAFSPLVCEYLTEKGFQTTLCHSGVDGVDTFKNGRFDLCILDVKMPFKDGFAVAKEIRDRDPDVPFIFLTGEAEKEKRIKGLQLGADDYVTKPFHLAELLARVRSLLRRTADTQVSTLRVGPLSLDLRHRVLQIAGRRIELTGRELGLLELLMRHAGRVVTRTEILDQVWGMHFDPESNVIEVHMRRLREKLGDAAGALETVRGQGYRLAISEASP